MPKFLSIPKIVFFLIIVGLIVFGFLTKRFQSPTVSTPTPAPISSPASFSLEVQRTLIDQKSKISVSTFAEGAIIDEEKLPKEVKQLLKEKIVGFKKRQATYEQRRVGYFLTGKIYLSGEINLAMHSFHVDLEKAAITAGWGQLSGVRTEKTDLLELENDKWQVKIIGIVAEDQNSLNLKIYVVPK